MDVCNEWIYDNGEKAIKGSDIMNWFDEIMDEIIDPKFSIGGGDIGEIGESIITLDELQNIDKLKGNNTWTFDSDKEEINYQTSIEIGSNVVSSGSESIAIGLKAGYTLGTSDGGDFKIRSFWNEPSGIPVLPDELQEGINELGGLRYSEDYSSTYTNRSLVDKEYVDNNSNNNTGLISSELVEVKPLPPPSGVLFYMDVRFEKTDKEILFEKLMID